MQHNIPQELESIREAARRELGRLKPADINTFAQKDFLLKATRSDAGRALPPYYLVYFLLVDLLGFKNLGQFEKVAWSVPVDFDGRVFLIEYRKSGLGVFVYKTPEDEAPAAEIVRLVTSAVKRAEPYFQWRADQAAAASALNVHNHSSDLYQRFRFFADAAIAKTAEAEARMMERIEKPLPNGGMAISFPSYGLRREASWLSLAAVEHFYSWTEHIFIHLAILNGKAKTGDAVACLAKSEWADKYKAAIGIADSNAKQFYDDLLLLRRQVRNFIAHGSFGKDGEAFSFHSGVGAVPMRLTEKGSKSQVTFGVGLSFNDKAALKLIESFIAYLWSGPRRNAKFYIQETDLPTILTYANDGTYARALSSEDAMIEFTDALVAEFDRSANMDF